MDFKYYPIVVQVVPREGYFIYSYFSDGRITLFDIKPLIKKGGVFSKLSDARFFSERLTVMNNTASWDVSGHFDPTMCIDIDPFELYEAPQVSDPLSL